MPIKEERLCKLFTDLVKIPSPSRNERGVADYIRSQVESLGYAVKEDAAGDQVEGNAGNLLVAVPATGEGPKLFLLAHMDTVEKGESPIVPCVDGHDISSQGDTILGADDKCGCAVLLEFLHCLKDGGLSHGELLIGFSVAEEIECLGVQALDPSTYKQFDAGIVLDHSMPNEIIIGAPTKLALRITVTGVGGHGAYPNRRVNAAHALAMAVSRLPSGRLDEHTTANLGIIRSGERINIIPQTAYAEYEIRSHRADLIDYHLTNTLATIEAAVREHRRFVLEEDTGLGGETSAVNDPVRKATVEVDVKTCYETYRHASDTLPVALLAKAIAKGGGEPRHVVAQGGSDASILNSRGLPSAVFGCGMHGAHSVTERADLREMTQSVEVLLAAIHG